MRTLTGERAARLVERQMAMFNATARASAALEAPPERPAEEAHGPAPYITISRQYGTGGSEIAGLVAEQLGWSLYDRELIEEMARDAHLQERLLAPFDEYARDTIEHWIRSLLTEETVSEHHFSAALFRVLSSIAKVGRAVIVGRGAHLALPPEGGLRVRLYAPMETRVAAIAAAEKLSAPEAKRRITKVEETRQEWLNRVYGDRAASPFTYDLAINTDSFPAPAVVGMIQRALELRIATGEGQRD